MENMTCSSFSPQYRDLGSCSCCFSCLEMVFSFLAMILLFVFGLKALGLNREDVVGDSRRKPNDWGHGFCSLTASRPVQCWGCSQKKDNHCLACASNRKPRLSGESDEGSGSFEESLREEVLELNKALMVERERLRETCLELEKERKAAASSVESVMNMIFKLQNEMSLNQLEARQYRELAKEKQNHDREMIEHLKWVILNVELRGGLREHELKLLDKMTSVENVSMENRGAGDEILIPRKQGNSVPTNHVKCEGGEQ